MTARSDFRSRKCRAYPRGVLAAILVVAGACQSAGAIELSEAQRRGKQIYFDGTSPRQTDITAVVGEEAAMLPGSAMPCASCHGSDGLGRPEGGVTPLDIRWSELVKTYGHVHEDGRRHPAFDEASFARSMIGGVDPANNQMDRSMPLYQMSSEDMSDLVAYMKVLEFDLDPGIEQDRVQVASLLPLSGGAAVMGQTMARVMQGHFAEINEKGGIFGRRIELLAVPLGSTPEASIENLRRAFDAEGIFALVGAYTIGLDDLLLNELRSTNVPLVGAFTLDPGDAFLDAAAFYIYAGFEDQVRVLADQALRHGAAPQQVIVAGPEAGRTDVLVAAAVDRLKKTKDGTAPAVQRYATGEFDAAAFAELVGDREALIFLGPQNDLDSLLGELAKQGRFPRIYLLSSLVAQPLVDAPAEFDQRIFIAYPTLGSDMSPKGREEYQRLVETYSLPREHLQAQLAALGAAKLLAEGLRRAGRNLSRVSLVEGLEELYDFRTGVTPPLSFGPNRRVGARGAHIVAVDIAKKRYAPLADSWYDLR